MPNSKVTVTGGGFASYNVAGAVAIADTPTPVVCGSAEALREAGHPDSDILHVVSPDVTIIPASLGSILRPRAPMRNSDVKALLCAGRFNQFCVASPAPPKQRPLRAKGLN